jgi:hypothetical protein
MSDVKFNKSGTIAYVDALDANVASKELGQKLIELHRDTSKVYIWIDSEGNSHLSIFDRYQMNVMALVDPKAFLRALEQFEPPIRKDTKLDCLGEL